MTIQTLILEAEPRIRAAGLTVDEFCKLVGVSRAQWQRWKSGATRTTTIDRWNVIRARVNRLPRVDERRAA